jgi:hypothetical protein
MKYPAEVHGRGGVLHRDVKYSDLVHCHSDSQDFPPFIGLYGYDSISYASNRRTSILGGLWAGFRYIEKTQEVWFSPLSLHEVQHVMTVPSAGKEKHEEALFEDHHAQFVARVWIIRDGQTVPPDEVHHRWTKVRKWVAGDNALVYHQWAIWAAVWEMIEGQAIGRAPYTLRL